VGSAVQLFGNRIYKDGWYAASLHGNNMLWNTKSQLPFAGDTWHLFEVKNDFSIANDLAAKHPEKLAELEETRPQATISTMATFFWPSYSANAQPGCNMSAGALSARSRAFAREGFP
jgi:hypothetical protein